MLQLYLKYCTALRISTYTVHDQLCHFIL